MNRLFIIILTFFFAIANNALAQQWHTTLDIRRPATKAIPDNVEDLLIVNNAVRQPDDLGHSTLDDGQSSGPQSFDLSKAPAQVLFAAAEKLDYSYFFWSVGLVPESQNKGTYFSGETLTISEVETLCQNYNANAVLALDRITLYDKQESFLGDNSDYYAYLEIYANSSWTLFYRSGNSWASTILTHSDTLFWEGKDYDRTLALEQLPDRHEALLDVAAYTGELFAESLIPQWSTVDRYLYENQNPLISEGMKHFTYRRWEKAVEVWEEAYEADYDRKKERYENRAYAAANIAVAEEILGDLVASRQWAKESADAFGKIGTADAIQQQVNLTFYMREIEQRLKDENNLACR